MRALKLLAIGLVFAAALVGLRRATFDPTPWLEDQAALRDHLSAAYANLEWAATDRGIDLPAADARARAEIAAAGSDVEAALAIDRFLDTFRDGHLRLDVQAPLPLAALAVQIAPPAPAPAASDEVSPPRGEEIADSDESAAAEEEVTSGPPPWPADLSAAEACDRLGVRDDVDGFELDVDALPGAEPVGEGSPFPAVRFALPGGRTAGLIRIPIFDQHRFRAECEAAWGAQEAAPCDEDCQREFRWGELATRLLDALGDQIDRLADADVVAVDLTGNGGGTDWVDPAARMFSPRPLACPRISGIVHDHWRGRPEWMLEALAPALDREDLPPEDRALLELARERLVAWGEELSRECDLGPLWRGEAPGCTRLTRTPITACGPVGYAPPDALTGVEGREIVFEALGFGFEEGRWSGPLAVLVDRRTASASEHFAAILQDGGAAAILGERTDGSGCGYTGSGAPITLPRSGLTVKLPDCVRWRADGTNELEGVIPDAEIPWSDLSPSARADAVVAALAGVR